MRRVAFIALGLCLAIGVAGCSLTGSTSANSGGFTGTKGAIAVTLNTFSTDASSNNPKDLCANVLDQRLRTLLGKSGGCQSALTTQLKTVDDFTLTIKSIAVSGKDATARVQVVVAGKKQIQQLRLHHDPAGWRVDSVA